MKWFVGFLLTSALDDAIDVAKQVKQAIYGHVGRFLRCSIGLAPNRFLAKVASNMQKPDGLTHITHNELPYKLYALSLRDLPGIGRGMMARLSRPRNSHCSTVMWPIS